MAATPMMGCGHSANGKTKFGDEWAPACVICVGLDPGATVVAEPIDLAGRMARCSYHGRVPNGRNHGSNRCKRGEECLCEEPSSSELAFFAHRPAKEFDEFYCGCWGWD